MNNNNNKKRQSNDNSNNEEEELVLNSSSSSLDNSNNGDHILVLINKIVGELNLIFNQQRILKKSTTTSLTQEQKNQEIELNKQQDQLQQKLKNLKNNNNNTQSSPPPPPPPLHFNHDLIKKLRKEQQIQFEINNRYIDINNCGGKKVKKLPSSSTTNTPSTNTTNTATTTRCGCKMLIMNTHSLCSVGACSCFKSGHKCTIKCLHCKGLCSNGKSISDELFFKVWRNMVIRNEITGDKRLEIIREKDQFKIEIIQSLNRYNIQYNEIDINHYVSLYHASSSSSSRPEINLEYILEEYFKFEREKRFKEFRIQFRIYTINYKVENIIKSGSYGLSSGSSTTNYSEVFRGMDSSIIRNYVNTILPTASTTSTTSTTTIEETIKKELKSIEIIIETLKSLFKEEGLEFRTHSPFIKSFIKSGEIDTKELIESERVEQIILKSNRVNKTLKSFGINSVQYPNEIDLYTNTFKSDELISKKVKSFDQIIQAERLFNHEKIEKQKRTNLIINSLKDYFIIFRPNSEIIIKFINNIIPLPPPPPPSPNETIKWIDEPTIKQVLKSEKQSIELIKNQIIEIFKKQGLKFNEKSINFINLLSQTSGYVHIDEELIKLLIESEIKIQKLEKEQEIKNEYKKNKINKIVFYKDRDNYINIFKPDEIIEKNVLSLEQLIKKELNAINNYQPIIKELNEKNIKIRKDLFKNNNLIQIYLSEEATTTITKDQIIKFELNYSKRKKLLKSKLKDIGLYRKGSLSSIDAKCNYGDENDNRIFSYLNDEQDCLSIDEIINQETYRWKNDKSEKGKQSRLKYVEVCIRNSNEINCNDLVVESSSSLIVKNGLINEFIDGTIDDWEKRTIDEIIEYQIQFTKSKIEDDNEDSDNSDFDDNNSSSSSSDLIFYRDDDYFYINNFK